VVIGDSKGSSSMTVLAEEQPGNIPN